MMQDVTTFGAADQHETSQLVREGVRGFLEANHGMQRVRAMREHPNGWEREVWKQLAAAGWLGLRVPQTQGGAGLSVHESTVLCSAFGEALLPEPFVACGLIPSLLLPGCPSSTLRDRLLTSMLDGTQVLAAAWNESSVDLCSDTARRCATVLVDGAREMLHLNGHKRFVAGAAGADAYLVWCRHGDHHAWVCVSKDAPGCQPIAHRMVDGSVTLDLEFRDVLLPADAMLVEGAAALQLLDAALEEATLGTAAMSLAVARQTLERTLAYLRMRVQFGRPIGSFQVLQHRAVDLEIECSLAEAALRRALASVACRAPTREADVSAAKALCAQAATQVTRDAVQLHGGIGYTDEIDIGLYLKSALRLSASLGSLNAHRRRFMAGVEGARAPVASGDSAVAPASLSPGEAPDQLDNEEFRQRFRAWLQACCPDWARNPVRRLLGEQAREWFRLLHRHGWRAPGWPREHGGMGLSVRKQLIYREELERAQLSRTVDMGVTHIGPTLMQHGTAEQKAYYLPRILNCEHWWCQGYSEPNAGSDLASLSTRATREGDHFVVNGRKIWTSFAADSTHVFLLVRTSSEQVKQRGITFLLAELATPGITIRPIENLAGIRGEFCEVLYDGVRVPAANVVGAVGDGWNVSRALLGMERLFIGSPTDSRLAMNALRAAGEALGLQAEPEFVEAYAALTLDLHAFQCFYAEASEAVARGQATEPQMAMLKIVASEHFQRSAEALMRLTGETGASGKLCHAGRLIDLQHLYMVSRPSTIYGGTSEIQRNILSKRLLGLPTA